LPIKVFFEFKNGTLIRHGMNMGDRTFIFRFGDQDTTGIGVERMPENIEQEITFSNKADRKCFAVFGLAGAAIIAAALKIQDAIKARIV